MSLTLRYRFPMGQGAVVARVTAPELCALARSFYRPYRDDGGSTLDRRTLRISLSRSGARYRLTGPSGDWYANRPGEALALFEAELGDALLRDVTGFTLIHGAAVRVGAAALILVGPSGAGKSTLTAFLRQRGHPALADDTLLLDRETGRVRPFPRPIRVHDVAARRLGLNAARGSGGRFCPPYLWWEPEAGGAAASGRPVAAAIFLEPGEEAAVERLAASSALRRLLVARFGPGRPARDFDGLALMVAAAPAYRLAYPALEAAPGPLEALVRDLRAGGAAAPEPVAVQGASSAP